MNRDTKPPTLPSLIGDLFTAQDLQSDNILAAVWTKMNKREVKAFVLDDSVKRTFKRRNAFP